MNKLCQAFYMFSFSFCHKTQDLRTIDAKRNKWFIKLNTVHHYECHENIEVNDIVCITLSMTQSHLHTFTKHSFQCLLKN